MLWDVNRLMLADLYLRFRTGLTLEDGTDKLSQNFGKKPPF